MIKNNILLCAALTIMFNPIVSNADTAAIDTGTILQQIKSVESHLPLSPKSSLIIKQENGKDAKSSKLFRIQKIKIIGNTHINTEVLHSLVGEAEGKMLTLGDLGNLATLITDYYNKHGYLLVKAIIPAQTIQNGIVTIQIIEVNYDQVILKNSSRVDDSLLQNTLSPLKESKAIVQEELHHSLLLLSDIPGVVCNATLKPGRGFATSDLLVHVAPTPRVSGNVIVDNYGNRYTGRGRISTTVNVNNPLHYGDKLSIRLLSSGRGMNYGQILYESVINGSGTKIGGSYSALHYILGEPIAFLNAHGTAQVESIWIRHPLIRTQDFNLYGLLEYDKLHLYDHIDASTIKNDRHLNNGIISLNMDSSDMLLSGGMNIASLGLTIGHVAFDNASAQLYDEQSAKTEGKFTKLNLNLARLQRLNPDDELYLDFSAQWASGNLDSSAKVVAGGPYSVRSYDVGAISGDASYETTAELRHKIDPIWGEQFQAIAFIDTANVILNKSPWMEGTNDILLSAMGLGFNWRGSDRWSASAYVATRLGPIPILIESSSSTRAWAEIRKEF